MHQYQLVLGKKNFFFRTEPTEKQNPILLYTNDIATKRSKIKKKRDQSNIIFINN